ncbi:MAG: lipoprotein [Panacagrimonas sp.]|jgi:rare lipoprotein A|nr:lipoprotein [Panacagrimonas sp.]
MSASFRLGLAAVAALSLAACSTAPPRRPAPPRQVSIPPPKVSVIRPPAPAPRAPQQKQQQPDPGPAPLWEKDGPPRPEDIPEGLAELEELVPQDEPLSPGGNMKSYEVFGHKYHVLASAEGFRETGLASWYGKKFHGRKTSNGERYDMFALSGAHKNLPLPCYVRVTNLGNGKSVIVRINDRGPFHSGRIIDLSYAAAVKLDTVGKIATVEIEAITPGRELPPPPRIKPPTQVAGARPAPRLLQVAAYTDPINAVAMREELAQLGIEGVQVRVGLLDNGDTIHRVMVGPFDERKRMDETRIRIRGAGFEAIPITD